MITPCTHTQTVLELPCSIRGRFISKGDKPSWQPCQSPFFPTTLQKIQFSASHSCKPAPLVYTEQGEGVLYRSSTQNSGLASGTLPNLSHALVWSWSDSFVSQKCLSGRESAGRRWVKSLSPDAHFHLKTSKPHTVLQGGGGCVRCQTLPDSCNDKNQSQQQIKPTPNEVLPMSSKYCSWLPRK